MFTRYEPRRLDFLGHETIAGYRLKTYSLRVDDAPLDRERFAAGWSAARAALPQPARADGRPAVGFAIAHQGRTGDYLILGWWDRENELPVRVWLRDGADWRPAAGGESFCVWDLRVLWWEREAYVATVLAGRDDGIAAYLATTAEGWA
jgi:hypothetical protein